jgi:hypothetical protein
MWTARQSFLVADAAAVPRLTVAGSSTFIT